MRAIVVGLALLAGCGGDDAAQPAFQVPVPSFRVGPRSRTGGGFGQPPITGSIRLASALVAGRDVSSWAIYSRLEAAQVELMPPRSEGSDTVIDFTVSEGQGEGPAPPSLTVESDGFRACGGTPGNTIIFVSLGTELAVAFAAAEVPADGSCVTMPAADVALLGAFSVDREGRIGRPGETLFP